MTTNQNRDDASSLKKIKSCDKGGAALWSDLNHDLLFLILTRLGFLDFSTFSKVCKSWRSLASTNKKRFMASKPPMSITISPRGCRKECYLEDFEGRKFKTVFPNTAYRKCVGLACGYLVFFGRKMHDFWLVNPITKHELRFPKVPFDVNDSPHLGGLGVRGVVVFSSSMSAWLFVVTNRSSSLIWFSIAGKWGKRSWKQVTSTLPVLDIIAFQGKIYTLNASHEKVDVGHVCELRLNPEPKLTIFKTKNFPMRSIFRPEFVNYGENLYLIQHNSAKVYEVYELDFGEMKWVVCSEKRRLKKECDFFISHWYPSAAVKGESWWANTDKYDTYRQGRINRETMWYFPHECLDVIIS